MYTLNKESTEIQQIIKTLGYATCAYQQERIEEEKTEWVSDESFAGKKGVCVWGGGGNESEEHRVPVTTLLLMLQDRRKGRASRASLWTRSTANPSHAPSIHAESSRKALVRKSLGVCDRLPP